MVGFHPLWGSDRMGWDMVLGDFVTPMTLWALSTMGWILGLLAFVGPDLYRVLSLWWRIRYYRLHIEHCRSIVIATLRDNPYVARYYQYTGIHHPIDLILEIPDGSLESWYSLAVEWDRNCRDVVSMARFLMVDHREASRSFRYAVNHSN